MYKGRKILAVLTARGGSKGLPDKNIRELAGKPLIAWTIENAKASAYIDMLVVSTDSQAIASLSRTYGADVPFMRPAELAKDSSPTSVVIIHALDFFKGKGQDFDYVMILEPTSPLRKKDDLDKAIVRLIDNESHADALISVGEVHLENPLLMKKISQGFVQPYFPEMAGSTKEHKSRHELAKVYFPYGVVYLMKTDAYRANPTIYQERTLAYPLERWQNYEIDDIYDFVSIEAVLRHVQAAENEAQVQK